MNRSKSTNRSLLLISLIALFIAAWIPSCTHDPFSPIDVNPVDTTGNPVDTLFNEVDTSGVPCDPNAVYFENQVLPIIKANCAKSGCHDPIKHEEGLILDSYSRVMKIVKANNLSGSKLYKVITQTSGEESMPPYPNQRLSADQVALIRTWIQQGAKNLTCNPNYGLCDTTDVSYAQYITPLLTTFCTGCHSGGQPSGNLSLTSYNDVQAIALNGKLAGAITWAQGYKKMPEGSNQLSSCTINKVKSWIHHGAPNN